MRWFLVAYDGHFRVYQLGIYINVHWKYLNGNDNIAYN